MLFMTKLSCESHTCCKCLPHELEPWLAEPLNDDAIKQVDGTPILSSLTAEGRDIEKPGMGKKDVDKPEPEPEVIEFDIKSALTDAEKALVVESFLKFSAMDGEKTSRLEVGTRVERGPDWKYGNQDGGHGHLGLVTGGTVAASSQWAYVKWDTGHYDSYRWGQQGKYDLKPVKAGVLLFKNLFLLAPETLNIFPFKDEEDLFDSPKLKNHSAKVIGMLRFAVAGLADLERLRPTLQEMGRRHSGYGVKPRHYEVLGEALINTLKIALNDSCTPATEIAWKKVYDKVSSMMASGAYSLTLPIVAVSRDPPPEGDGTDKKIELTVSQVEDAPESKSINIKADGEKPVEEAKPTDAAPEAPKDVVADAGKEPASPKAPAGEDKKGEDKKAEAKTDAEPKAAAKKKKITHKERLEKWKLLGQGEQEAKRDELQLAAKGGELATVLRLLDTGMIANAADDDGCTALHLAAHAGHRKVIIALLNASADPKRATKSSGRTAVMLAATKKREDALELLVPRSNLAAVDSKGFTVVDLAKDDAAEWLRNDPLNTPPPWKVKKEQEAAEKAAGAAG